MSDPSTYQIRPLSRADIERVVDGLLDRAKSWDSFLYLKNAREQAEADRALARELQSLIEATDDARKEGLGK